ncbi:MAG: beta-ketoacyl-ACP synthase III [Chitinivibrionales bacterium]|nr:beta-ketoacyl-ACP synthase III [Chitinivibrionales bacterium]
MRSKVLSVGSAVPDTILTNKDLEKYLDTTDEWITTRTGIKKRHVFPPGKEAWAYELGAAASLKALKKASMAPADVDCVICATFTPDYFFPSTACKIQHAIGCTNAFAFDLSAACAGFVYALTVVDGLITSGKCKTAIVVGAEVISKTLDWNDRSTAILFGDAAAAVVLQAVPESDGSGILSTFLKSDGSLGKILYIPAWGEKRTMSMNGGEVFKHAVRMMADATCRVIDKAGLTREQIDLLIPHQANIRIMKAISQNLGLDKEKLITNVDKYGNTSSASIPLALEDAWLQGKVKKGTVAALTSLGGGVTVGSAIIRF